MYPTLRDIAKIANVSPKTVSRVINEEHFVNEKTRMKIQRIIQELGYRPNYVARSLRKNKTNTIGYIIPDMANPFFGLVGRAIEKTLRKRGYSLIISTTRNTPHLEIETLNLLLSKKVDGIIFATIGETRDFLKKTLVPSKIPVVIIDNKIPELEYDTVLHDNVQGAFLLTRHLIEHGHRCISFIAGPLGQTSGQLRLEGYKRALEAENILFREELVRYGDWQIMSGYEATSDLIKSDTKFQALFAANSVMALGVLKAIRAHRLKVPRDIALVSFDDLDFAEVTEPPLTTIRSVESEIGQSAVKLLLARIEKEKDSHPIQEILIPVSLNIRQSCGCE